MGRSKIVGLLVVLAVFAAGTPVYAGPTSTFSFTNITHNNAMNAGIGEAQLFVEVLPEADPAKVRFRFFNTGPLPSSISDVYFDDGALFGIADIVNGPGVQFSVPATPANLPGGNNVVPPFVTTTNFSADSDPPAQANGVNPGEELSIVFALQGGQMYSDVLNDLASRALRIGIHVQGFESGTSESFINEPPAAIPAPGAAVLCLLGTGLAGGLRRRRMLNG